MTVKEMIDLYLKFDLSEETWEMMWHMACHGLITQENWRKFFDKCEDWYLDHETNTVIDGNGKTLYIYDEYGFLTKA